MAEADSGRTPTLSEQYLLKGGNEEKVEMSTKPVEESRVEIPVTPPASSEESPVVPPVAEETPVVIESSEAASSAENENSVASDASVEESNDATPSAAEAVSETVSEAVSEPAAEESSESTEPENSADQEVVEDKPEIKLETAPADFRFPTTNQSRHCFTRYIEYHRCVAAKGDDAPECDKFAKYYRSLCPGEWVDRWNEQRGNGTFPGPL